MRTEISHFWLGTFESESDFGVFFGENENYYKDERDIDDSYLSKFSKSQNEKWFDHDFFECGFENGNIRFEENFSKYSYSKQWLTELENRVEQRKLSFQINSIAFIKKGEIEEPTSVKGDNFELIYLGEIEYEI